MRLVKKREMTSEDEQLQSIIFFLSDHVCTSMEASEAILAETYEPDSSISALNSEQILQGLDDFHRFLERIRHYEYLILTRLSQARHWATQLRFLDPDFRQIIDLFTTATNIAADANKLLGEDENDVFNGAGDPQSFMESRRLVVRRSSSNGAPSKVYANEDYLLGGGLLITDLIDMCETFHNALETRYAAFDDEKADDDSALLKSILEKTE